jgi:hypothetical protein
MMTSNKAIPPKWMILSGLKRLPIKSKISTRARYKRIPQTNG